MHRNMHRAARYAAGAVLACAMLGAGIVAHAHGFVGVQIGVPWIAAPPAPTYVVVRQTPVPTPRIWIPGHWEWQGDGHVWVPGHDAEWRGPAMAMLRSDADERFDRAPFRRE